MLTDRNRIFLNLYGDLGAQLKHATARGDWVGTKDILAHDGKWITDQVTASGLRERGGTGLPIGEKWSLMPEPSDERQNYLVADADNREILRHEPHKLLEGCIYAGTAIGAKTAWIYARGEFAAETKELIAAIDEAYATGLLGADAAGFDIRVHCGMDACIYGEESALLESLEGRKGMPRTVRTGLWGCPVMVDNIETLAMIPAILKRGADWFASLGRPDNTGTKLFCLTGHVERPCVVEEEMGIPVKSLIDIHAGGVRGGWDNLKAIIPGGVATSLLPKTVCDHLLMDFDSLKEAGSGMGTGTVIVIDKSTDMIAATANLARFYKRESCGQCTPCREGTGWMLRILERMVQGRARIEEIDQLQELTEQIEDHTICAFGDAAALSVQGLIRHFRSEIEDRIIDYRAKFAALG